MVRRASCGGIGLKAGRQGIVAVREEVIGLEGFRLCEPEVGDLGQHFAFARDAVGHDDVKGGDAVGGDEEQAVAQVEDLAHFAALELAHAGQIELEQGLICHAGKYGKRRARSKEKSTFAVRPTDARSS